MRKSAKTIRTAVRMVFALYEEQLQAFRSAACFLGSRHTAALFLWDFWLCQGDLLKGSSYRGGPLHHS